MKSLPDQIGRFLVLVQKDLEIERIYFLGIGLDKFVHFFMCFSLVIIFIKFNKRRLGIALVLTVATMKELIDLAASAHYGPITRSVWRDTTIDLTVDFLGVLTAVLAVRYWYRWCAYRKNHSPDGELNQSKKGS